jgi:C-terminal processing protease CtpA/Prc
LASSGSGQAHTLAIAYATAVGPSTSASGISPTVKLKVSNFFGKPKNARVTRQRAEIDAAASRALASGPPPKRSKGNTSA